MARKRYVPPVIDIMGGSSGGEGPVTGEGSGQGAVPGDVTLASFSAWKMAVENANLEIDSSYAGYVKWMTENGYGAYIQPDDSELQ